MKKLTVASACWLLVAIGHFTSIQSGYGQIQAGSGPDSSFLVVEAAAFGAPQVYEWHYTFNPLAPPNTADMLTAVDLASVSLDFNLLFGGTFLDSITYHSGNSSLTLTNEATFPYSPFWAQWVSGGTSGDPLAAKPSGVWSSGYGITYRELAPGSWDGFIFNGEYDSNPPYDVISAPPTVAPVPETSPTALLVLAGFLLFLRAKTRLHDC